MTDFVKVLRDSPLESGNHKAGSGHACVMEKVSILWGLATGQDVRKVFSDLPPCTNAVVARTAQRINDRLGDDDRQGLNVLIPRLLRARRTDNDPRINVRLAIWSARKVLHLIEDDERRAIALRAIESAEVWLAAPNEETRRAASAASAAYASDAAAAAAAYAAAYASDAASDASDAASDASAAASAAYASAAAASAAADASAAYASAAADAASAAYAAYADADAYASAAYAAAYASAADAAAAASASAAASAAAYSASAAAAAAASAADDAAYSAYAAYAAYDASQLVSFLDELLDAWEEAASKENEDIYVPQAWEDEALAYIAEITAGGQDA